MPSNEDRGYVLRRIIRRAVLQAHLLGASGLVMPTLVGDCIDRMADGYPELVANRDAITATIEREEGAFHRTLTRGAVLLDNRLGEVAPGQSLAGDVAFDLYETYGFPLEVTEEVAAEAGVTVDHVGLRHRPGQGPADLQGRRQAGRRLRQPHELPAGGRGVRHHRLRRSGAVRGRRGHGAGGRPR